MVRSRFFKGLWLYALIGGGAGAGYVLLDEGILDWIKDPGGVIPILHEIVDAVIPVLLGVTTGIGIGVLKRLSHLNKQLSLKKQSLEKELLFGTLISQLLHEIQNPLHNISAVLEEPDKELTEEKLAVIRRNLERLAGLKKQYGERDACPESFEPDAPVSLKKWLDQLVEDKLGDQLSEMGVRYQASVPALLVRVHPILLEQMVLSLFSNALEALEKIAHDKRELWVSAKYASGTFGTVELTFRNKGTVFSQEMLASQGRRVFPSRHGLGIGLLLLNRMVEQSGGQVRLANDGDSAAVTLTLPGEAP